MNLIICPYLTGYKKRKFFLQNVLTNAAEFGIISDVVNARVAESADAHV